MLPIYSQLYKYSYIAMYELCLGDGTVVIHYHDS